MKDLFYIFLIKKGSYGSTSFVSLIRINFIRMRFTDHLDPQIHYGSSTSICTYLFLTSFVCINLFSTSNVYQLHSYAGQKHKRKRQPRGEEAYLDGRRWSSPMHIVNADTRRRRRSSKGQQTRRCIGKEEEYQRKLRG